MDRVALGRGSEKEHFSGQGTGQKKKKKVYRKMIRFSVCASDFSSQRKNMKSDLRDLSLPIFLMPFDGREKNSNVSQNQGLGLHMLIALSLSVYTPQVPKSSSNFFAWLLI